MTDLVERLRAAEDHTATAPALSLADVVRGGERRRRRRRVLAGAAVAAVLAVVVPAALLLPQGERTAPATGEGRLALLDRPQQEVDRLPAGTELEVVPSSTRRAWTDGRVSVFAARDAAGAICVVLLPGPPQAAGSSCSPADTFAEQGAWVAVQPSGAQAYLVPDGRAWQRPEVIADAPLHQVAPNAFVVLPSG